MRLRSSHSARNPFEKASLPQVAVLTLARTARERGSCSRDRRSAVFFADIMNGADVWMVQRRRRLRFSLKPRQYLRVLCHIVR